MAWSRGVNRLIRTYLLQHAHPVSGGPKRSAQQLVEIAVANPTGSSDSASTKQIEPTAINRPIGAPSGKALSEQ